MRVCPVWLPSALNPADAPSRVWALSAKQRNRLAHSFDVWFMRAGGESEKVADETRKKNKNAKPENMIKQRDDGKKENTRKLTTH